MRYLVLLAVALAFTGCAKKENKESASTTPANENQNVISVPQNLSMDVPSKITAPPEDPNKVIMEVNGVNLTVGAANQEVEYRLASLAKNMPPERIEAIKPKLRDNVIDQFVVKTVLQQEVERQKIAVTEDEIKKAYDDIRKSLPEGMTLEEIIKTSPIGEEKMKEEVVMGLKINKILAEAVSNATAVTDADISKFCAENKDIVSNVQEMVRASHILIKCDETAPDTEKTEKKKLADDVRNMLLAGSNFVDMAKTYSDCPSKEKGGDLGPFPREQMVPAFSEAAFSLETNKISNLVQTKFGWHIIKVVEHMMPNEIIRMHLSDTRKQEVLRKTIDDLRSKAVIKDFRPKSEEPKFDPTATAPVQQPPVAAVEPETPAPAAAPAPVTASPADKPVVNEVNANK